VGGAGYPQKEWVGPVEVINTLHVKKVVIKTATSRIYYKQEISFNTHKIKIKVTLKKVERCRI
jgi:hypothetical protein